MGKKRVERQADIIKAQHELLDQEYCKVERLEGELSSERSTIVGLAQDLRENRVKLALAEDDYTHLNRQSNELLNECNRLADSNYAQVANNDKLRGDLIAANAREAEASERLAEHKVWIVQRERDLCGLRERALGELERKLRNAQEHAKGILDES